jgi:hypothetical protein
MARWDKFLNRASQGYGVGFERYGQYADARDKRLDRADSQSAYEAQQRAMADQAVNSEQYEVLGKPQALPTTSAATQPATPPTAVDTAAPPALLAKGTRPTKAVPRTAAIDYTQNPINTLNAPGSPPSPMRTTKNKGKDKSTAELDMYPELKARGEAAEAAGRKRMFPDTDHPVGDGKTPAPGKKIVPDETNSKAKKESTKAAISETLTTAVDPKTKAAIVEGMGTRYVKGATRANDWQIMKDKLAAVAIRNGDYETLMGLDAKVSAMQLSKVNEHTTNAIRLLQQGDTQGAAEALYQANGYYPDGTDLKLRMQPDGSLVGYGFDEASGEFKGGVAITAESLSSQLEAMQDPIAFQKELTATRIATEQREHDRRTDKRDYLLDKFEAQSGRIGKEAEAFKNTHLGLKYYGERMGYDTDAGATWGNFKSYQSYVKDSMTAGNERANGDANLNEVEQFLYTGVPGGAFKISGLTSSIAGNTLQNSARAPELNAQLAERLLMEDTRLDPEFVSENSDMGRLMEKTMSEVPITDVTVRPDGNVEAMIGGEYVMFKGAYAPNLVAAAQAGPQAPAAPEQGGPQTAVPVDSMVTPQGPAMGPVGQGIADAAQATHVGTIVKEANAMFQLRGSLAPGLVDRVRNTPPELLEDYGLDPALLEQLGE